MQRPGGREKSERAGEGARHASMECATSQARQSIWRKAGQVSIENPYGNSIRIPSPGITPYSRLLFPCPMGPIRAFQCLISLQYG